MAIHTFRFAMSQSVKLSNFERASGVQGKNLDKGNFQYAYAYQFPNGACIRLWCEPLPNRLVSGRSVLELELDVFEKWTDFMAFINSIIPDFEPAEARTKRIDIYTDTKHPISLYKQGLLVAKKRNSNVVSSSSDTYYIGKKPLQIAIYDRGRKIKAPDALTRVEIRFYGNASPIATLSDIKQLLSFLPYKNFSLFEFIGGVDELITDAIERSILKNGLQQAVRREIGMPRFRMLLRKGYFKKLFEPDLDELYLANLKTFLDF